MFDVIDAFLSECADVLIGGIGGVILRLLCYPQSTHPIVRCSLTDGCAKFPGSRTLRCFILDIRVIFGHVASISPFWATVAAVYTWICVFRAGSCISCHVLVINLDFIQNTQRLTFASACLLAGSLRKLLELALKFYYGWQDTLNASDPVRPI